MIRVSEFEKRIYMEQFAPCEWNAYAELKSLVILASDALLPHERMIIHSTAFALEGRAWLLAAPSGTGKSTQYRNLKELYPDAVEIICGDNPVLQLRENDILVHPSPWNGKEGWGSDIVAPLAGIVLLEQAKENELLRVTAEEAAIPVFRQMETFARTEEPIHKLLRLEERLITSVPLWRFCNTGDPESSRFLYETILEVGHEL